MDLQCTFCNFLYFENVDDFLQHYTDVHCFGAKEIEVNPQVLCDEIKGIEDRIQVLENELPDLYSNIYLELSLLQNQSNKNENRENKTRKKGFKKVESSICVENVSSVLKFNFDHEEDEEKIALEVEANKKLLLDEINGVDHEEAQLQHCKRFSYAFNAKLKNEFPPLTGRRRRLNTTKEEKSLENENALESKASEINPAKQINATQNTDETQQISKEENGCCQIVSSILQEAQFTGQFTSILINNPATADELQCDSSSFKPDGSSC